MPARLPESPKCRSSRQGGDEGPAARTLRYVFMI